MQLFILLPALAACTLVTPALHAQEREATRSCCRHDGPSTRPYAEIREIRIPASGTVSVDAGNGGVSVSPTAGREIEVSSRIEVRAGSPAQARVIAEQVRVETTGGRIRAQGPAGGDWWVTYDVRVPAGTDLRLEAGDGRIAVRGVRGTLDVRTTNGPVELEEVGGSVRARTASGPITVRLSGERWAGNGLDAESEDGPVSLWIPEGYSARLDAGTLNGPFHLSFPVTTAAGDRPFDRVVTVLGSGGAPLRLRTTNGPINIRRP